MDGDNRALLVDTTGFLFRAFHALAGQMRLARDDGFPTGAIFVTLNMLRGLVERHPSARIACVMDAPGRTFREDIHPEYKANRDPMDKDLARQIEPIKRFIGAMGLRLVCIPGVEADDVIATLRARALDAGMEVLIATGDKDLMQLVDARTLVVDNLRGEERRYDEAGVLAKHGVRPDQIADFLALVGDTSDNIPGVEKVGPKTAAKWLGEHGSLENIVARKDGFKGVVGENLRKAVGDGRLERNLRLVRLKDDVELGFGLDDLAPSAPDEEGLRRLGREFQLRSVDPVLRALRHEDAGAPEALPETVTLRDREALREWLAAGPAGKALGLCVHYKAREAHALDDDWEGLAIGRGDGASCYVPAGGEHPWVEDAVAEVAATGREIVTDDAKRLDNLLARRKLTLGGRVDDTGVISFVLNSQQDGSPESVAHRLLDTPPPEPPPKGGKDDAGPAAGGAEDSPGPAADALPFPVRRAGWVAAVAADARDALRQGMSEREWKVYETIDRPLVPVLARMERDGVRVDKERLDTLADELAGRMADAELEIHALAGEEFNVASPIQVAEALFDRRGLPSLRRTHKGARSTDESVLAEIMGQEGVSDEDRLLLGKILEHRGVAKLRSTYAVALARSIHGGTGRVHTHFSQVEAATGRLSSSRPNLQNIPVRTEDGRRIRQAFVASDGCVLVSADYSQIELRVMAHMSGDAAMSEAFCRGEDIHRATAAEVLGIDPGAVDDEQRRRAKATNFGLIYGMSDFGLAAQLGISREEAGDYITRYFDRYPGVRDYMGRLREQSDREGHVETLFGRRVHSPRAEGHASRQAVQRSAINAPLQGTAADLVKMAMVALDRRLAAMRPRTRMVLQVHDELLLEVPEEVADEAGEVARETMADVAKLNVPLVVNVRRGRNWDEAH